MTFALTELPPLPQDAIEAPPFARWRSPEGDVVATLHKQAGGYLARFIDRADFEISLEQRTVRCVPIPDMTGTTVEDIYLNQVLPMIRGQQGELVIHASAVAPGGQGLGFVAESGRGKSTLAAAFARSGVPFLSDDGLFVTREGGRYFALPNRPSVRLWQDSEAALDGASPPAENDDEKTRLEAGESLPFQPYRVPLRVLYFLGAGENTTVRIAPMTKRTALARLINHAFLLDAGDPVRLRSHFETLAELAEAVPGFTLDYPRDYRSLDGVIAAVVEHASMEDTVS